MPRSRTRVDRPHWSTLGWSALAAAALLSCGRRPDPVVCDGAGWSTYDGFADGAGDIRSGCVVAQAWNFVRGGGLPFRGPVEREIRFFREPPQLAGSFCMPWLSFMNTQLVSGASGALQMGYDGQYRSSAPAVLTLAAAVDSPGTCSGNVQATLTGGTWHVIQGGDSGDVVEVEARNVTFAPVNGRTLRIDRMWWRVRLPPPPGLDDAGTDGG